MINGPVVSQFSPYFLLLEWIFLLLEKKKELKEREKEITINKWTQQMQINF